MGVEIRHAGQDQAVGMVLEGDAGEGLRQIRKYAGTLPVFYQKIAVLQHLEIPVLVGPEKVPVY